MIYNIKEENSLDIAANLITKGEIIVYPTDTIYGFGVDATNYDAINKINKIKNRKSPYSILVDSFEMIEKYAIVTKKEKNILHKFLPGPFTFILKKRTKVLPDQISLNLDTIGVRIPKHHFSVNIVTSINKPIVTTSVNLHASDSINSIKEIEKIFPNINIFEDYNKNNIFSESTIVDLSATPYKVLREGSG